MADPTAFPTRPSDEPGPLERLKDLRESTTPQMARAALEVIETTNFCHSWLAQESMGDSPLEPTAADVLTMVRLVLEREAVLYARAARDKRARLVAQAETGADCERERPPRSRASPVS